MDREIIRGLKNIMFLLKGMSALGVKHVPRHYMDRIKKIEKKIQGSKAARANSAMLVSDLSELEQMVRNCTLCDLARTRKNVVFGEGARNPILMLVGEAPGREEDKQGRPFVGRSGELLTKMLRAINLERSEVFITSVIKCRPPGNRTPKKEEIEACLPYLLKQIELLDPRLILCLGSTAAKTLLNTDGPLSGLRGKFHNFNGRKLLVTYHPAYLLRFGGAKLLNLKRQAWHDLQMLQKEYDKIRKEMETH